MTVLAGWLVTGVYLDAWAHISRLPDSFWTPWHAILYSGLMACGVFLFVVRGTSYRTLLGRGYDLSLAGFVIAMLGGVADAIAIALGVGTWWSPTFATGVIAVSAMTALLVSSVGIPGRPEGAAA